MCLHCQPIPILGDSPMMDAIMKLLKRTFGSRTRFKLCEDLVLLKKNVPSGGRLHPIEKSIERVLALDTIA